MHYKHRRCKFVHSARSVFRLRFSQNTADSTCIAIVSFSASLKIIYEFQGKQERQYAPSGWFSHLKKLEKVKRRKGGHGQYIQQAVLTLLIACSCFSKRASKLSRNKRWIPSREGRQSHKNRHISLLVDRLVIPRIKSRMRKKKAHSRKQKKKTQK